MWSVEILLPGWKNWKFQAGPFRRLAEAQKYAANYKPPKQARVVKASADRAASTRGMSGKF